MSDTTTGGQVGEPVDDGQLSPADLQKMLDQARSRVSDLERERDHEREARRNVERERDGHAARVVSEAEQRYNTELSLVSTALNSATESLASAKAAFKAALAEGDHDKAADLQEAISRATVRREQAEGRKAWLEGNKTQFVQPPAPPRQDSADDEYQRTVSAFLPQERDWLANRPQFKGDMGYRNRVYGASQIAINEGLQRGSSEYFRRMETVLGEGRQEPRQETAEAAEPAHRPSADVAPTRRSQPGAAPAGRVRVELTADQREMADFMFKELPEAERYTKYFDQVQRLKAAGRM